MNQYPLTLQFSVGTSVNNHLMITDLSKQVQTGFIILLQYFFNTLKTKQRLVDLQNIHIVNGRIHIDLNISKKNNYTHLIDNIDKIEYWNFPHVVCSKSNTNYSLVDMTYI